jgi:hypothetical protein
MYTANVITINCLHRLLGKVFHTWLITLLSSVPLPQPHYQVIEQAQDYYPQEDRCKGGGETWKAWGPFVHRRGKIPLRGLLLSSFRKGGRSPSGALPRYIAIKLYNYRGRGPLQPYSVRGLRRGVQR